MSALKRMEAAGLTVIPVLDGASLLGAVEIRTLLAGGISDPTARTLPVSHWVSGDLPWLDSGAELELLHDLALRHPMVFVVHEGRPYGFVTPLDLALSPELL